MNYNAKTTMRVRLSERHTELVSGLCEKLNLSPTAAITLLLNELESRRGNDHGEKETR